MIVDVRFLECHIEKAEAIETLNKARVSPLDRTLCLSEIKWSKIAMSGYLKSVKYSQN